MKTNYHTHTYRCGHAHGNEEDMIKAAIHEGYQEIGICCHIPFPHYRRHLIKALFHINSLNALKSFIYSFITGGPHMRMPYKMKNEHLKAIDECKEKYKDQINVHKGFEAEGLEEYFDYYQSLLNNKEVDYLILGHHFHKYCIHNDYFGRDHLTKEDLYNYLEDIEKALDTNMFSYLAHPDLFIMGYKSFDEDMQYVSRRICEKAKEKNIPLEINAGGIRRKSIVINDQKENPYTNSHFFKIASEVGNDIIIGIDAHKTEDFNQKDYDQLVAFAKENNLQLINQITFLKGR